MSDYKDRMIKEMFQEFDSISVPYIPFNPEIKKFWAGDSTKQPCAWDSIPEEDRGKPMLLCCNCPKCSVYC